MADAGILKSNVIYPKANATYFKPNTTRLKGKAIHLKDLPSSSRQKPTLLIYSTTSRRVAVLPPACTRTA